MHYTQVPEEFKLMQKIDAVRMNKLIMKMRQMIDKLVQINNNSEDKKVR